MALTNCEEGGKKLAANEFLKNNPRRLYVEFDAVVSDNLKESTINNIYIKELNKNIEVLVPNDIKENEKIWKKAENDSGCELIEFTVRSIRVDSSVKSIPPQQKSKRKAKKFENKTIYEVIESYNPNGWVRFFDDPGVSSILVLFITYTVIKKLWYIEMLITFLIIASILIVIKIFCPFHNVKKYIKKNHIDDAIRNDTDFYNIAVQTYNLMPCRRMLNFIKKINMEAGSEIERQLKNK